MEFEILEFEMESPPQTSSQMAADGCTMARIFMGVKASMVSAGKKRLSTTTWTLCAVDLTVDAARLESNASHTPAHLALQREVAPQAWK